MTKKRRPAGRRSAFWMLAAILGLSAPLSAGGWQTAWGGTSSRAGWIRAVGPTSLSYSVTGITTGFWGVTPVVDNGVVFISPISRYFDPPYDSAVEAVDVSTGRRLWQTTLPLDGANPWNCRVTAARGGLVYATRAGNTNSAYIYALDERNGLIVWKSQDQTVEYATESPAFADNGDLIEADFFSVFRIRHTDGTTLWKIPRSCDGGGGCSAAVFRNRVYVLDVGSPIDGVFGSVVRAFDVNSGTDVAESAPFAGWSQNNPMVGRDGTVYVALSTTYGDMSLAAYHDTGQALVETWELPIGNVAFATFGEGPDGSIYAYSPHDEIIRIDALTGAVLNTSRPLTTRPFPSENPRIAIDRNGTVYVVEDNYDGGVVESFRADLAPYWSQTFSIAAGGMALAADGTLIVGPWQSYLRFYRPPTAQPPPLPSVQPVQGRGH